MQLHLVPAENVRKDTLDEKMFVTITPQGNMYVLKSSHHLHLKELFVRFYLSPERKEILAWTYTKTVPMNSMKEFKQFRLTKQNQLIVCIRGALAKSGKFGKGYSRLEVKVYDDKSLIQPNKYYYVEIK